MRSPLAKPVAKSWRETLLEAQISPEQLNALPEEVRAVARDFMTNKERVLSPLSAARTVELDSWYHSTEGQQTLSTVALELWAQLSEFKDHAMPAHDARHAMFKVPSAALEYVESERVQGWERVGVLGALLHDHGRWAEERLLGGPGEGVFHARLSFVLGQELLGRFEMPEEVRAHILLAALRHTSGADPHDPMPLKLTVAADRDQLYGPELVLRLAHSVAGADGSLKDYFEKPDCNVESVLSKLSRFLVTRLPGPLFSRDAHVQSLWQSLCTVVLASEPAEASQARFGRLRQKDSRGVLTNFDWKSAWTSAQERAAHLSGDSTEGLQQLLIAPHVAPSEHYRQLALEKVERVPVTHRPYLLRALSFANEERLNEDERLQTSLARLTVSPETDQFLSTILTKVLPSS